VTGNPRTADTRPGRLVRIGHRFRQGFDSLRASRTKRTAGMPFCGLAKGWARNTLFAVAVFEAPSLPDGVFHVVGREYSSPSLPQLKAPQCG